MNYTKFYLFGKMKSRGTFDDFFNTDKYDSLEAAYAANDYVEADFVRDEQAAILIELRHSKNPDKRLYHRLNYQEPRFGLDISDDNAAMELAKTLMA